MSFTSPFTSAHVATLANPSLIFFVISSIDSPFSTSISEPSFNVIFTIKIPPLFLLCLAFGVAGR